MIPSRVGSFDYQVKKKPRGGIEEVATEEDFIPLDSINLDEKPGFFSEAGRHIARTASRVLDRDWET